MRSSEATMKSIFQKPSHVIQFALRQDRPRLVPFYDRLAVSGLESGLPVSRHLLHVVLHRDRKPSGLHRGNDDESDIGWMEQVARNVTDCEMGSLIGKRHPIIGRDVVLVRETQEPL